MKQVIVIALLLISATISAAAENRQKGLNVERLKAADKNQDGLLSSEELGKTLWKRIASFDANAD